jgi:hypothetical protein
MRGAEAAAGECEGASNCGKKPETPTTTGHGDLAAEGMGAADTAGFMPQRLASSTDAIVSVY